MYYIAFLAMHNMMNKSAIVGHTHCRWEQTEHWEAKLIPNHLLPSKKHPVKYELYSSKYFVCCVQLLSDNGILCKDWNQVGLPCAAKSDTLSAFLSCLFISASHPKPPRRLFPRRNRWPWPTMATWICNGAAIPHKDALGPRTDSLTASWLLASTSITYYLLSSGDYLL